MKNILSAIKRTRWIILLSGLLSTGLCSSIIVQAQDSTAGKTISQNKFQRLLKKNNTVLLDVRTADEYKAGHLPGALQIDVMQPDDFKNKVSSLYKKKKYLLYCRTGKRSNNAKVIMKQLGFIKLYDLKGGFSEWQGPKEKN
jgi:rhodanese-related sulfurtransferase